MAPAPTGNVGIGINTPTARLDVNGTTCIRSTPLLAGSTNAIPLYVDTNGNVVRSY